jgi:hypothetical protein
VLIPQLAGSPSGAAAVFLLKLVPVCWNEYLRGSGLRGRVVPTEPSRNQVITVLGFIVSRVTRVIIDIISLGSLFRRGEGESHPLLNKYCN